MQVTCGMHVVRTNQNLQVAVLEMLHVMFVQPKFHVTPSQLYNALKSRNIHPARFVLMLPGLEDLVQSR